MMCDAFGNELKVGDWIAHFKGGEMVRRRISRIQEECLIIENSDGSISKIKTPSMVALIPPRLRGAIKSRPTANGVIGY